jgi:hypothetical protein
MKTCKLSTQVADHLHYGWKCHENYARLGDLTEFLAGEPTAISGWKLNILRRGTLLLGFNI